MTYDELVATVRTATQNTVVSKVLGHVAYQFNVEGEGEGAIYLELDHGKINVEPYEYYDRDVIITTSARIILEIASGKLDIEDAFNSGKIHVRGNLDKAYLLKDVIYFDTKR